MNRTIQLLARISTLVTTILGLAVVTAGHAAAARPNPGPVAPEGGYQNPVHTSVLRVTESSVSVLQWALFAVAVVGALAIGAASMHLAQRRRLQPAH